MRRDIIVEIILIIVVAITVFSGTYFNNRYHDNTHLVLNNPYIKITTTVQGDYVSYQIRNKTNRTYTFDEVSYSVDGTFDDTSMYSVEIQPHHTYSGTLYMPGISEATFNYKLWPGDGTLLNEGKFKICLN